MLVNETSGLKNLGTSYHADVCFFFVFFKSLVLIIVSIYCWSLPQQLHPHTEQHLWLMTVIIFSTSSSYKPALLRNYKILSKPVMILLRPRVNGNIMVLTWWLKKVSKAVRKECFFFRWTGRKSMWRAVVSSEQHNRQTRETAEKCCS